MPFPDTKSTSQHQSWEVLERLFGSLRLAFWLILTTPWIVFLLLICHWSLCRTKWLESVSTQVASVGSTVKSGVEKFNTQVLYRSSKSLKQLSDVALQNGIRGGSATVHFPIWHQEIEDILILKKQQRNGGQSCQKT